MDLAPLVWQPITQTHVGECLSLRLEKRGSCWFNPLTDQTFSVDAASGLQAVFHCWKVASVDNEGKASLSSTPSACFIQMPFHRAEDYQIAAELCAGVGGTSLGALLAGINPWWQWIDPNWHVTFYAGMATPK